MPEQNLGGGSNVQNISTNTSSVNTGSSSKDYIGKSDTSNVTKKGTETKIKGEAANLEQSKDKTQQPTAQQIEQAVKKYKLKIDGKEEEVDENEIVRLAQLGKSAYQKFQQAAEERKKVEEFKEALKEDFVGTLQKHGEEFGLSKEQIRSMIEDYLLEQVRLEQMSPEERKVYEMEQKLKEYEEKERLAEEERQYRELLQLQEQYAKNYEKSFTDALTKNNMPVTPYAISRMASYMEQALEAGYELEPEDCVRLVQEDYKLELKDMFDKMNPEDIISFLGRDVITKIKQYEIKNVKNKYANDNAKNEKIDIKESLTGKKNKNWKDFLNRLDSLEKGESEV